MTKWDYAQVLDEWYKNAGKPYQRWRQKELTDMGYTLSSNNSQAERISIIYFLVEAEERSEEIWKSLDQAILDMGKNGFEMVSYVEQYEDNWGHRRFYFKRPAV